MAAERTPPEERSLLAGPLIWVTELTLRAPQATLFLCGALALLCAGFAFNGLEFKTSRLDLLSRRSEYNRRWLSYQAEFGEQDDAVVVVQGPSPEKIIPVLDELAAELKQRPKHFASVFHVRDLWALKGKGLHFLPPERVREIDRQVAAARATLDHGAAARDVVSVLQQWNDFWEGRPPMDSHAAREAAKDYAALTGGLLPAFAPEAKIKLATATSPAMPADLKQLEPQHLLAAKGRIGFVLTRLVQEEQGFVRNDIAVKELQGVIAEVAPRHPEVWIGLTGMPVVEHDEMEASNIDTFYATLVSLIGLAVLFMAGYGGLRHAGLACLALMFGIAWSFGYVTLAVGHLNILSQSFGAILIGLGIDFGIHYVAGYLQLRHRGVDCRTAILTTACNNGPGVVTGAVTTAGSFFMAGLTEFVGIAELGVVAGGGVLCCVLSAVIVLPPLLLLVDETWPLKKVPGILPLGRWLSPLYASPQVMMGLCLIIVVGLSLGLSRLRYDHNLLNMQPRRLESAAIERELFTRLDDSIWYAISVCESRAELLERKEQLTRLESVAKVEEIVSLMPTPDADQTRTIARMHDSLLALQKRSTLVPVRLPELQAELSRAERIAHEREWDRGPAGQAITGLQHSLSAMPEQEAEVRLANYREELAKSVRKQVAPLNDVCDPIAPALIDLPSELTARFVGKNQRHLLKIYARGNIWEMNQLQAFIADCEKIDPLVTGHPVQTYYVCHHLQQSYIMAGLMSLVVVFGLVYLDFQSVRDTLLAMLPLALGSAGMFGIIGWLDVPLNPANMIVLPIILGIGVDDGVHLMHEFRRQKGRFKLSDATATAVLLTSTTTMVSFGAMIVARHQGLQTLGQVLTLGVGCCLATSLLFFPAMLRWLTRDREDVAEGEEEVVCEMVEDDELAAMPMKKDFFAGWNSDTVASRGESA